MIYTVTLNPAIDCIYRMDQAGLGITNRAAEEYLFPGGKGVNVSILLKQLGEDTEAAGFLAGATGKAYEALLGEQGISGQFVYLKEGNTRINLKISAQEETEFNGKGPSFTERDIEELCDGLSELTARDIVVLSGNVSGNRGNVYGSMMERLRETGCQFVVDTTGEELRNSLPYHPFLIKPNAEELGAFLGQKLTLEEEILAGARNMQKLGARNVLVSRGAQGALFLPQTGKALEGAPIKGDVKNSVGAGDSMIAGFLHGWIRTGDLKSAFRYGIAAGTATAFSFGIASRELTEKFYERAQVKEV